MTPDEYRRVIAALGFKSLLEAGRWLGVSDSVARKWGIEGPSGPASKLLWYMAANQLLPADVDDDIRREAEN